MNSLASLTGLADLKNNPWLSEELAVPPEVFSVNSMLSTAEKRMLYYLTREYYSGRGAIADMGTYLGGSTICFAVALQERGHTGRAIHSYDLFKLSNFELERDFKDNPPRDLRTREIFDHNLREYASLITVHEGDVLNFPWTNGPIELLFIDIAKSYKVFDHILLSYFPSLVPNQSLVILQDYIWKDTGPWHHVVMEKLSDYFEYLFDTTINSVVFVLTKPIPREELERCLWTEIPFDEKVQLMDRAIEKMDAESKKEHLRQCRALLDGRDMLWGQAYHAL
jgi:hypothetical protein